MMRQALVALGPKSVLTGVLVGGAALALGALFVPHAASGPGMYRLVLHAPEEPGAFYLSAWVDGDVFLAHDGSDRETVTFSRRGDEHDGCSWLGTEKLTPIGPRLYAYRYAETILSCRPDATPFRKTPRTGIVTVETWDGAATPTALTGIQPPGDVWNLADNDLHDGCVDEDDLDDAERELAQAQRELEAAHRGILQALHDAQEELQHVSAADDDDE
jgi:hypothetical protein